MKTLAEQWDEFRTSTIASNASDVQVKEMKVAFYAGVLSILHNLVELETDDGVGVGEFAHAMNTWITEVQVFSRRQFMS